MVGVAMKENSLSPFSNLNFLVGKRKRKSYLELGKKWSRQWGQPYHEAYLFKDTDYFFAFKLG
ncbi:MAG: hypothetical protein FD145_1467 [Candidatus Saganbacteria bacterium]|uniref:Uncharacterized protein n=1 Tax=Candidatus Saganbacteria bacterium TaxID=2575572 RepID=A0A833KZS6_UNCSA|nr:MAG: hypothetical protein FD145_1467 [Candidatus Saganbacteria bacterium]